MDEEALVSRGFINYDKWIVRYTDSLKAKGYIVDEAMIKTCMIKEPPALDHIFAEDISKIIPMVVFMAKTIWVKEGDKYKLYKKRELIPNETTKRAMEEGREILERGAQFETPEEMFKSLHVRDVMPVISMHANGKSLKINYVSAEIDIEGKSNDEILIEYINKVKEDVEGWEDYGRVEKELTFFVEANKIFPNVFSVKWEYI